MTRFLVIVWGLATLSGCHDPDSFLSGKWFSDELTLQENTGDAAALAQILGCKTENCELFIEMNLGHYGQDVVGVLRLYRDENRVSPATCEVEGCSCRSIRGAYRGDDVFRFNFLDCNGCTHMAEIVRDTDDRLVWTISTNDYEKRGGTGCGNSSTDTEAMSVDFTMVRLSEESQLTVSDKACDECTDTP